MHVYTRHFSLQSVRVRIVDQYPQSDVCIELALTGRRHALSEKSTRSVGAGQWVLAGLASDEGEELLACLGVIAEHPQHSARHRLAVQLLHAPHHHAHVSATPNTPL